MTSKCELRLKTVFSCLLQEPRWWQWRHLTLTTQAPITRRCATTSSGSRRTSPPQPCSTSIQNEATSSLSSPTRYLTERLVDLANVCIFVCVGVYDVLLCSECATWRRTIRETLSWTGSCHKPLAIFELQLLGTSTLSQHITNAFRLKLWRISTTGPNSASLGMAHGEYSRWFIYVCIGSCCECGWSEHILR